MKSSTIVLFLLAASILADQPLFLSPHHVHRNVPNEVTLNDDLVYSQRYMFEKLYEGCSNYSGGNRWVCDDFELDGDYYVTEMHVWMIWTGAQATTMNLVISEDDLLDWDPNTNIDVWAESVPCTNTFTGDNNWGYDIYETYCIINADSYPELNAGVHYYFETQSETYDNSFILCPENFIGDCIWYDDGCGEWERPENFCPNPDLFFEFYGEPVSALESETWGSIKTLF